MKPETLNSLRRRLNDVIDRAIRECVLAGPTDLNAVYVKAKGMASMFIRRLLPILGDQEFRNVIQQRLKRTEVPIPKAVQRATSEAEQPELPFSDLEQFRGVPNTITYEDAPGHVAYIHYAQTLRHHRIAGLALLRHSLSNAAESLQHQQAANDFLESLVERFGDLPAAELVRLWQAEQQITAEA